MKEEITFIHFPSGFAIGIPSRAIIKFLGNEGEALRLALLEFEEKITEKLKEKEQPEV